MKYIRFTYKIIISIFILTIAFSCNERDITKNMLNRKTKKNINRDSISISTDYQAVNGYKDTKELTKMSRTESSDPDEELGVTQASIGTDMATVPISELEEEMKNKKLSDAEQNMLKILTEKQRTHIEEENIRQKFDNFQNKCGGNAKSCICRNIGKMKFCWDETQINCACCLCGLCCCKTRKHFYEEMRHHELSETDVNKKRYNLITDLYYLRTLYECTICPPISIGTFFGALWCGVPFIYALAPSASVCCLAETEAVCCCMINKKYATLPPSKKALIKHRNGYVEDMPESNLDFDENAQIPTKGSKKIICCCKKNPAISKNGYIEDDNDNDNDNYNNQQEYICDK